MSPIDYVDFFSKLGVVGLLSLILWGSFIKIPPLWYSAHEVQQLRNELEQWREMALRATGLSEVTSEKTARALTVAQQQQQRIDALQKEIDLYATLTRNKGRANDAPTAP